MKIPITYNLRNLLVRRGTSIMTALGIALPVAVLLTALALIDGLGATFAETGHKLNVLVLRKGSNSELGSSLSQQVYRDLLYKPGIAHLGSGEHPLVSPELVTVVTLPKPGNTRGQSITLRGLLPVGLQLRHAELKEGRWFQAGRRELVVGLPIALRSSEARLGGWLTLGNATWQVVGIMDAGNAAFNSEIVGDLNQVSDDFNRRDQFNSILVRGFDDSAISGLLDSLNNNPRLNVDAQLERGFYKRQTASGAPLKQLGLLIAVILSVGSCFSAMNTMYAAVSRRSREIGTLRMLGFSGRSILLSFLVESALLAGFGGVVACLVALPLNVVSSGVGNFTTMSETMFRLRVGPEAMLTGMLFSAAMGVLGGLFPARNAARKEILDALREN